MSNNNNASYNEKELRD